MDNVVSINHTKENVIEFDLTTEGVETKDICVRFVIETKNMDLMFKAKKAKGDKWEVKIPALSILEKTAYNCRLEINSDGYYFEPMKGTVNVVGTAEIYTSAPKNKTLDSSAPADAEKKKVEKEEKAVKAAEKKEEEKKVKEATQPKPIHQKDKSIEQIARELMEGSKIKTEGKVESSPAKPNAPSEKDEKIHAILESQKKPAVEPKKPLFEKKESSAIKKVEPAPVVIKEKVTTPIVPQIPAAIEQPTDEKKDKVRAILEEAGFKPKNRPKRPRMSFVKLK